MAAYRFDLLNVIVAEDSPFMRGLIVSSLRAIGVERIKTCCDGSEAVELLKLMRHNPGKAGLSAADLIISDWHMAPVGGDMLLKWVRRAKDSPDRFLPFLVITAFSDPANVRAARDLGATDVMAKPFSVESILRKIVDVIERPRQFVKAGPYFGPDRRRHAGSRYSGDERRTLAPGMPGLEVVAEG